MISKKRSSPDLPSVSVGSLAALGEFVTTSVDRRVTESTRGHPFRQPTVACKVPPPVPSLSLSAQRAVSGQGRRGIDSVEKRRVDADRVKYWSGELLGPMLRHDVGVAAAAVLERDDAAVGGRVLVGAGAEEHAQRMPAPLQGGVGQIDDNACARQAIGGASRSPAFKSRREAEAPATYSAPVR